MHLFGELEGIALDSTAEVSRVKLSLAGAVVPRATPTNPAYLALCAASTVLLLQGPIGPFYDRLARWLQAQGKRVLRVAFQGGDLADCRAVEPLAYRGTLEAWPAFLGELLVREKVDAVVLFGQSRSYHAAAVEEARDRHCAVIVLEEG